MPGMPVRNDRIARLNEWEAQVETDAGRDEFLQRCSKAKNIDAVCVDMDLPRDRVVAFLAAHAELDKAAKRALESYAHARFSEIVDIADGDSPYIQRDRLKIYARKITAEVYAARTYAPKQETVARGTLVLIADLDRVADALLTRLSPPTTGGRTIEHDEEGEV